MKWVVVSSSHQNRLQPLLLHSLLWFLSLWSHTLPTTSMPMSRGLCIIISTTALQPNQMEECSVNEPWNLPARNAPSWLTALTVTRTWFHCAQGPCLSGVQLATNTPSKDLCLQSCLHSQLPHSLHGEVYQYFDTINYKGLHKKLNPWHICVRDFLCNAWLYSKKICCTDQCI